MEQTGSPVPALHLCGPTVQLCQVASGWGVWLHTIVLLAQVVAAGKTFLELVPALIDAEMYSPWLETTLLPDGAWT